MMKIFTLMVQTIQHRTKTISSYLTFYKCIQTLKKYKSTQNCVDDFFWHFGENVETKKIIIVVWFLKPGIFCFLKAELFRNCFFYYCIFLENKFFLCQNVYSWYAMGDKRMSFLVVFWQDRLPLNKLLPVRCAVLILKWHGFFLCSTIGSRHISFLWYTWRDIQSNLSLKDQKFNQHEEHQTKHLNCALYITLFLYF